MNDIYYAEKSAREIQSLRHRVEELERENKVMLGTLVAVHDLDFGNDFERTYVETLCLVKDAIHKIPPKQ